MNNAYEKLTPKANELEENISSLASTRMWSNRRERIEAASEMRKSLKEELEQEAVNLGLGIGFFASILLRWAISQLVAKIMKRWLE